MMKFSFSTQRFFHFLILFFCTYNSFAQAPPSKNYLAALTKLSYIELDSFVNLEYFENNLEGAMRYTEAAYQKSLSEFDKTDSICLAYTSNLGFFCHVTGAYKRSEQLYLQVIKDTKATTKETADFCLTLDNLANLYRDMGYYEKAEPLFLQSKDILMKTLGEEHLDFAQNLSSLAFLYQAMGNYEKAEPLYLQTKNILSKTIGNEHSEYARILNNLANLYYEMGRYEIVEPLFIQSQNIWAKTEGEESPNSVSSLNNLANFYQKMGNYEKAVSLYLKAQKIGQKNLGPSHRSFATILNNLANLYCEMGDYKKAKSLYFQSKNIWEKNFGKEHPNVSTSLNNLADLHYEINELDTALNYCLQGMDANSEEIDSSMYSNELWANLDKFTYYSKENSNSSIKTLLKIIEAKYKKTGDKNQLENHYKIVQSAIRLNERIRNDFSGEGDKLRSLETNNFYVLEGIKTAVLLQKGSAEAFEFAELNKGVLLLDAAKATKAYSFGDLPDSLGQEEQKLQKKHAELQAVLLEKHPKEMKDSLLAVLNKTKQEIENFTKTLQTQYPKYAAIKYENKIAKAADIQALLDNETALLEYVIGDSVVYVFYVDKKKVVLAQTYSSTKYLTAKIKELHSSLSNYKLLQKDQAIAYRKYTENAHWFYKNLVAIALKGNATQNINKLIIVSDGELGHLPFEAFLVESPPQTPTDYHLLHYLCNDYKISYNYSATLWQSSKNATKSNTNGQLFAMASNYEIQLEKDKKDLRLPTYQRLRGALRPLPAAQKEVTVLKENFQGFFGLGTDASEKNFKEKAGDYAVIHLAMHGLLDAKNPILSSLAFTEDGDSLENNFLQAYEISKMKLNADLVVLSACETGYGKFEKGNGIASLAQAFAYAGAPAMIVSLWQVNDYATSEIMGNLYQNLAEGMDKDAALQEAKLQYMKNAKGILAHPAFWSPFILMGNTDAITLGRAGGVARTWWWIAGGLGVLALVGIFAMRKKNQ